MLSSCAVSVGLEYVDDEVLRRRGEKDAEGEGEAVVVIKEGEEVAIIPPVSSG